jgi:antirestriction protein
MNTEKIEKLKKSLSNTKIPADLKPKIEAEIKRLEDLDAKSSQPKEEVKEEVKPVAKKTTTRKPRTTKTVAKKTSTRKPSQTNKPKRTAMSVAKEIRKEGESWSDARARASKMMKEKTKTVTKDVESELEKLTKLVRSKKELKGQVGRTNLLIDAKRKAKPMGRRVSKDGNVYYENRANRTDRGTYGKYHLAEGGYLTDPTFGNFQAGVYAKGGGIRRINGREYPLGRNWTNDHNLTNKGEEHEINYTRKKLAKGGAIKNQYAGRTPEDIWDSLSVEQRKHFLIDHIWGNEEQVEQLRYKRLEEDDKIFIDYYANRTWKKLSGDVRQAFTSHVKEGQYAKGGGIRRKNGQTYDYGRVWTKDHNEFDKGADHEVNYRRKKFAKGGKVESLTKELYRLQRDLNSSRLQTYRLGDNSQEAKDRKNEREVKLARFNEVLKELRESDAKFELGGTVVTDLAGHTGGGTGGLNAGMPLDGFSNTAYTGLVGETGAMSSGEMFAKGGSVNSKFDLTGYKRIAQFKELEDAKDYADYDRIKYPKLKAVVIKENDYYEVWAIPVTTSGKTGNRVYADGGGLPDGSSQSYMITEALGNPAQHFAKGGGIRRINGREYPLGRNWTNDHEHTNKGEEHEVTYKRKGKFLGVFAKGGSVEKKYNSMSKEDKEELMETQIGVGRTPYNQYEKYSDLSEHHKDLVNRYFSNKNMYMTMADGGFMDGVYAKGGGVDDESPKIYVADLEAYNNGRLSGVWLDLADYNDADELMEAINDFLKTTGGEEYAIHDVEYIPSNMYSEYMGQKDFEELYEMIDLAKENDLPLSVVQEVVSQYDSSAVDEFQGRYDDAEDFAQQLVDDLGIESFTDFQYYLDISDTDRRLLSQDMADSYVEDIVDEDGGNRLIEEAGLDVEEYEEADSDRQEEMIDEAREIVYDEYYNTYMEGLSDPYYFLVEEQGLYDAESFANADFVRIDFEKLADALEQDYTFIYDGGSLYVFNIR